MSQSGNVIDLRSRRGARKPDPAQKRLFYSRPPEPETPKRKAPLRVRRRKIRALIALAVILLVAAIVYGVSWASYLPQFSIQTISVVGADQVPAALISDYAQTLLDDGSHHLLSRDNIFTYPRAVIEKDIVGYFPRIASANVSRASLLATAITVTVQERQQFALWCSDDGLQCYSMDQGGFIFAQSPVVSASSSEYVFHGAISTSTDPIGQSFVPAHLPGLVALLQLLGQAGFTPLGVTAQSDQDFSIPLSQGFMLKASFGEDGDTLTKNLQLILSSDALSGKADQLEYIDLRFGDRVYYKLKGQTEASGTAQQE